MNEDFLFHSINIRPSSHTYMSIKSIKIGLQPLQNTSFRWLFLSQTINLLGDSITWVGLALLAHDIAGERAPALLAVSLTIRVVTFVFVAPYAGVLADKVSRKKIMLTTHIIRMGLLACMPLITQEWQVYGAVLLMNVLHAFFTPTYKATVPQIVTDPEDYPKAISLSASVYQVLGILGPGLAGGIAVVLSYKFIFWTDSLTFLLAAFCLLRIPADLSAHPAKAKPNHMFAEVKTGTLLLFQDEALRLALLMALAISIVGAQVLVNSIDLIKQSLQLGDSHYGWTMSAMGLGAVLGALGTWRLKTQSARLQATIIGALVGCVALTPADYVPWLFILIIWPLIGMSQSFVSIPTDTLIADKIDKSQQGRVYGAHFAWSHFWWVLAYPLAGLTNRLLPDYQFLAGSLVGLLIWIVIITIWKVKRIS